MGETAALACDVLVVGGGAAGVAAAIELAHAGLSVELAEQRPALGGAYHRQPSGGERSSADHSSGRKGWANLMDGLVRTGIRPRLRHVFLGLDTDGMAMLDDREARRVLAIPASALVVAVGAVERVLPRPGWQLGGVMTAGGLQMLLKETGAVPDGDILVAGNGPLTVALGAELARLGRPPIAVVEAGDPVAQAGSIVRMAAFPGLAFEAAGHLTRLRASGVPWMRGTSLVAIERRSGRLLATVRDRHGTTTSLAADLVALHDGIRPNDFGLPAESRDGPVVVRAGDCREALGIRAATADGRRAAREVVALLSDADACRDDPVISRQRRAQAMLLRLFQPVAGQHSLADIPDDTVLCRCEGRTIGDLRAMLAGADRLGLREIKLNGRFGMGVCQGRFCAESVRELVALARPQDDGGAVKRLSRDRWPLRPVSIAALAAGDQPGRE